MRKTIGVALLAVTGGIYATAMMDTGAELVRLSEKCDPTVSQPIAGVRIHYGPEPMDRPPGHGCREGKVPEELVARHFPFVLELRPGQVGRLPGGVYSVTYAVSTTARRYMPDGILGGEQVYYERSTLLRAPESPLEGYIE